MRFDLCRDMIASGRAIAIARGVGEDEVPSTKQPPLNGCSHSVDQSLQQERLLAVSSSFFAQSLPFHDPNYRGH
jgi:hypothetical protein